MNFIKLIGFSFFLSLLLLVPLGNQSLFGIIAWHLNTYRISIKHSLETVSCRRQAEKFLRVIQSDYPLHRCEQSSFSVEDTEKVITRIYLVAGEVEPAWEFECGFHLPCSHHVAWFDDSGELFNFIDPPTVVARDLAVVALGCGEEDTFRFDGEISLPTELVYRNHKYWWRNVYEKTPSPTGSPKCLITGKSFTGYKKVLSSVTIDTILCRGEPCQSPVSDLDTEIFRVQRALEGDAPDACSWRIPRDRNLHPSPAEPYLLFPGERSRSSRMWDETCLLNYIRTTGDRSLCDTPLNFAGLDQDSLSCNGLTFVERLD